KYRGNLEMGYGGRIQRRGAVRRMNSVCVSPNQICSAPRSAFFPLPAPDRISPRQPLQTTLHSHCGEPLATKPSKGDIGGTMKNGLTAKAQVEINASLAKVWNALVDPALIRQYMFGTNAVSNWQEGAPIVWKGEWEGKPYEDKGVILQLKPEHVLQYSHF